MALVLSLSGMAQTGLVFSQCLTFTGTANVVINASTDRKSQDYVVPEGKIWKVEAICAIGAITSSPHYLEINTLRVATLPFTLSPLWLKAGDTVTLYFNNGSGTYIISILEFNAN